MGTGNDLARVLGWGAALDDDSQLPKLLESFERATTKMLDRWSIMTYEIPINTTCTSTELMSSKNGPTFAHHKNDKLSNYNLDKLEENILQHLNNVLQSNSLSSILDSSQQILEKLNEYNYFLQNQSFKSDLLIESSLLLRNKFNEFFLMLKNELRPTFQHFLDDNNINTHIFKTNIKQTEINISDASGEVVYLESSNSQESLNDEDDEENSNEFTEIYLPKLRNLKKMSKKFRNKKKIVCKMNKLIKHLHDTFQSTDKYIQTSKESSLSNTQEDSVFLNEPDMSVINLSNLNKKINDLLINGEFERQNLIHSYTNSSINKECQDLVSKSPSNLTINKCLNNYFYNGLLTDSACPLASEEQSCMSTPNTSKLSPSIDSIYKQSTLSQMNIPLTRPNQLNLGEKKVKNDKVSIKILSPSNEPSLHSFVSDNDIKQANGDGAPEIKIDLDSENVSEAEIKSKGSFKRPKLFLAPDSGLSVCNEDKSDNKIRTKQPPPLFLLPSSASSAHLQTNSYNSVNLNSSLSSNNLSTTYHEFGSTLGIKIFFLIISLNGNYKYSI